MDPVPGDFSASYNLSSRPQCPDRGLRGASRPRDTSRRQAPRHPARLSTPTSSPSCTLSEPSTGESRPHPSAYLLTRSVCLMACGASVYRRSPLLPGNVWDDVDLSALSDEVLSVVALGCSHTMTTDGYPYQYVQCCISLSRAVGLGQFEVSHQTDADCSSARGPSAADQPRLLSFFISLASGSVVLPCVALLSFSHRKSSAWTSPSSLESFSRRLKLFMLAAASIRVSSKLKR